MKSVNKFYRILTMIAVVLLSLLSFSCFANADPLLIGAFNVQVFGQSKMDKPDVVDILIKIVKRYDILMIQEIRDAKQTAFPELVDRVNAVSSDRYDFVVGPRTGRTQSKEQYGYIYKSTLVKVIDEYHYPDYDDKFERNPYTVRFERLDSAGEQRFFSYIALHAKPDDAVVEMDALVEVYDTIAERFNDKNVLLGGDFNADCNYVCSTCWENVGLWTDDRFTWLIDSNDDTNLAPSDCAYDRMVVAGSSMKINSRNADVFYFENEYNLTYDEASDVSDHRPIEFYLY